MQLEDAGIAVPKSRACQKAGHWLRRRPRDRRSELRLHLREDPKGRRDRKVELDLRRSRRSDRSDLGRCQRPCEHRIEPLRQSTGTKKSDQGKDLQGNIDAISTRTSHRSNPFSPRTIAENPTVAGFSYQVNVERFTSRLEMDPTVELASDPAKRQQAVGNASVPKHSPVQAVDLSEQSLATLREKRVSAWSDGWTEAGNREHGPDRNHRGYQRPPVVRPSVSSMAWLIVRAVAGPLKAMTGVDAPPRLGRHARRHPCNGTIR